MAVVVAASGFKHWVQTAWFCIIEPGSACFAGAEQLKEALQQLGLKCGGTPRQRAERLFSTRGKRFDELDPKLFAKGAAPAAAKNGGNADKQEKVTKCSELLSYCTLR